MKKEFLHFKKVGDYHKFANLSAPQHPLISLIDYSQVQYPEVGFGGYINPITLEAHINYNTPMFNMPTTISHEIAHQLGYSAENEANFIGIISSINSKNEYIKYSGYALGLKYLINEVLKRNKNEYKLLRSTINKGVLKNYEQANQTWLKFKNPLEKYFKKSYNIYLKANNQTKGIESYNLVVNLLINNYSNPEF